VHSHSCFHSICLTHSLSLYLYLFLFIYLALRQAADASGLSRKGRKKALQRTTSAFAGLVPMPQSTAAIAATSAASGSGASGNGNTSGSGNEAMEPMLPPHQVLAVALQHAPVPVSRLASSSSSSSSSSASASSSLKPLPFVVECEPVAFAALADALALSVEMLKSADHAPRGFDRWTALSASQPSSAPSASSSSSSALSIFDSACSWLPFCLLAQLRSAQVCTLADE
jgi:hypothetical protein